MGIFHSKTPSALATRIRRSHEQYELWDVVYDLHFRYWCTLQHYDDSEKDIIAAGTFELGRFSEVD